MYFFVRPEDAFAQWLQKKKKKKGRIKKNEQSETRTILLGMAIRAVAAKKKKKKVRKKKQSETRTILLGRAIRGRRPARFLFRFFCPFLGPRPPSDVLFFFVFQRAQGTRCPLAFF